jgi:crotonobetainyl-CoA:carnitine CoA-transferase CaiB-like acyl-CoA transferase
MRALEGIKVVDLSRILAGPMCTMTLGDLGADVWKVESPIHGDDTRMWSPPEIDRIATYYLSANRNKRSIAVDLKQPRGQAVVRGLIERADVLVENMRHGTLDQLGLGWDDARTINPRLIYCSISGYGRDSLSAELPGYDVVAQAESGLMAISGEQGGQPLKFGIAIVDLATGMNSVQAILAALIARGKTGEGQFIDMALLDSGVALLANIGTGFINTGNQPPRFGNAHPTVVPYQLFDTTDGTFILACGNDIQFRALCEKVVQHPELVDDPRFWRNRDRVINRETLIPILAKVFRTGESNHWIESLHAAGVPAGRVRDLDEVFSAPEVVQRGLVRKLPHSSIGEVSLLASPLRLTATPPEYRAPPPLLGQHTREILRDVLGMADDEIGRLIEAGIIRS